MKKNDLAEIKKMDSKIISEKIKKAKSELMSLIVDKNMGKLTNKKAADSKRKDIAQMMTILRQKQLLKDLEEAKNA